MLASELLPTNLTARKVAGAAFPLALAHVDVCRRVRMAPRAVRLFGIGRDKAESAQHVHFMTDKFQVRRIHTGRDTAEVIYVSLSGHVAVCERVGISAGNDAVSVSRSNKPKDPISVGAEGRCPQPAGTTFRAIRRHRTILINLCPKTFFGSRKSLTARQRVTVPDEPHVVAFAVALPTAKPSATFDLANVSDIGSHKANLPHTPALFNMRVVS